MIEKQKSDREKTIYSLDEARDVLYQNQIARQTFIRQIQLEGWPIIRIMKRQFLPAKFIKAKLAEIDAAADAALAVAGVTK